MGASIFYRAFDGSGGWGYTPDLPILGDGGTE
jgi:hypothetical protein